MARFEFTTKTDGRKLRVSNWVDTDTLQPIFGIEANIRYGLWANVIDRDGKVLLYPTREQARDVIRELSVETAGAS